MQSARGLWKSRASAPAAPIFVMSLPLEGSDAASTTSEPECREVHHLENLIFMGLEHKVINGARWVAMGMGARRLVGFVVFAVITRYIQPETLGLVALAFVYIAFVEMFSKQGLGMALIQRKKLTERDLNTAFFINVGSAILLGVVSFIFAGPIAGFLGDERLAGVIRILSITFPVNASTVAPIALQSRAFDFKSQALQSFLGTFVAGLIAIPMAVFGWEMWALVAQAMITSFIGSLTIWLRTSWRPSLSFDPYEAKKLTSFSVKILISNIMGFTRGRSDQILIGLMVGPTALGLYILALRLVQTIDSFVKAPLDRLAVSAFSAIQGDRDRLLNAICRGMRLNALFCCPVFVGLALLAPDAITIAFSNRWAGAAGVCSILALNSLAGSLFFFNYHVMISQGYPGVQTTFQGLQACGVIFAAFVGRKWGIEGIASVMVLMTLLIGSVETVVLGRILKIEIRPLLHSLVVPLVASGVMAGVVLALRQLSILNHLPAYPIAIILAMGGAGIYILMILVLSKSQSREAIGLLRALLGMKKMTSINRA